MRREKPSAGSCRTTAPKAVVPRRIVALGGLTNLRCATRLRSAGVVGRLHPAAAMAPGSATSAVGVGIIAGAFNPPDVEIVRCAPGGPRLDAEQTPAAPSAGRRHS